jgi:hypothetical protein
MAPVELFRRIAARPFRPFRLILSDGSGHDIRHPETISIGLRTTILSTVGEEDIRLDNLHITQILPLDTASVSDGDNHE